MAWQSIASLPSTEYYNILSGFASRNASPPVSYEHTLIARITSHQVKLSGDESIQIHLGEGKDAETLYMHQIDIETLKDSTSLECSTLTNLSALINPIQIADLRVDFEIEEKQCIYYPLTKAFAGRIIRMMFNDSQDPYANAERLSNVLADGQTPTSLLVTYYLSCMKVMLNANLAAVINDADQSECRGTDNIFNLIKSNPVATQQMNNLTRTDKISSNVLAFHALFGAYALCRGTQSKQDLSRWCGSRYNALMNSLMLQTNPSISFNLSKSGEELNLVGNFRPYFRALPYHLTLQTYASHAIPIKQHIIMLVSYANMTTYILINKVLSHGGPVLTLNPIPSQLLSYVVEKERVTTYLRARGDQEGARLPFVNILYPQEQFFKAASYPDMIVVAKELEIQQHSDPDNLIKNYKSKATTLATVNTKQVKQLLRASTGSSVTRTLTQEQERLIKDRLGIDLAELTAEANKVISN